MNGVCFFIGHRDFPQSLQTVLDHIVEQVVLERDIKRFVVGQYGNFDQCALSSVLRLKQKHLNVEVFILLAYYPIDREVAHPTGVDGTYYPADPPFGLLVFCRTA